MGQECQSLIANIAEIPLHINLEDMLGGGYQLLSDELQSTFSIQLTRTVRFIYFTELKTESKELIVT